MRDFQPPARNHLNSQPSTLNSLTWTAISAADVLVEFTPAEKSAIDALQGVTTSLATIADRVVQEFRQAIVDGGGQIENASTIPPGFEAHAVALARWRWLSSIPSLKHLQSEPRQKAAEKAEALIEAIADGTRRVAPPSSPASEAVGLPAPSFGTRDGTDLREREFTRTNQDG